MSLDAKNLLFPPPFPGLNHPVYRYLYFRFPLNFRDVEDMLAEFYQQQMAHLRNSMACLDTRSETLEIIRSQIERIVLHPVENGYEIEIVGKIANIVALANGISLESKKAASNQTDLNTYHSSVKLVAGARYQRCLHLDYACL